MENVVEKELNDYLDGVAKHLLDFAVRLANEKHNQMYAKLSQLMVERSQLIKRMDELEATLMGLKKGK